MPPTTRKSVAFFYRKHLHGYKLFPTFAMNFQSFFRFLMQIFVVTVPDFQKNRGFFMFHVKFLHKNFVSREKVIIFAATSTKGQSKTRNQ